ncbi:uncharacterized protein I206_101326 [Kwoniella pini CBS 10737]|uniref:CN hydrolase domain-containing protein n=1 Tax=Kwoniella pini CBS 10737 TaxID=1296096 RepID=A0A1B9HX06_9TREE|nr:uncharacterized protein I206_06706 [Kwoniella pini CBS 10737]OCF47799.1 hypothetical protein I206_06706 [Kwoniella pini CBS 10737]
MVNETLAATGPDQYTVLPGFKSFTLAMVQLGNITRDKLSNLQHTATMISKAACGDLAHPKVDVVMLPEIFNSPMECSAHAPNAEVIPEAVAGKPVTPAELPSSKISPTLHMLSKAAIDTGCWIIGGSMPEKAADAPAEGFRVWNTLTVWNAEGCMVAKYRKHHLYNVDVPGAITVRESDVITPGDTPIIVKTPFGTLALAICYDIRFPHFLSALLEQDPSICAYLLPSAFNHVSGPLAWEVLQRARAIDNQIYVGMCSPARDNTAEYISYGHSLLCAPNGTICSTPTPEDESETIVFAKLCPESLRTTRQWLPVGQHQRHDIYTRPHLKTRATEF